MEPPDLDEISAANLNEAIEGLREGKKCYLYAGSGLSCLCELPDWKELTRECVKSYGKDRLHNPELYRELVQIQETNPLGVYEALRGDQIVGRRTLVRVFNNRLVTNKYHPCHQMMLRLPFAGYITTNYDTCIENACAAIGGCEELRCERCFSYPARLKDQGPGVSINEVFNGQSFLLHVHGHIPGVGLCNIDELVMTNFQYSCLYRKAEVQETYKRLAQSSVCIVGAGDGDPYVSDMITRWRSTLSGEALGSSANASWYWIKHLTDNKIATHRVDAHRGIKPIGYRGDVSQGLKRIVWHMYKEVCKTETVENIGSGNEISLD